MNDINGKEVKIIKDYMVNGERFIVICAWCNSIKSWQGATLSHGICTFHRDQMMKDIKKLNENKE